MTNTMTTPAAAEQALASRATIATGAAIGAGLALLANLVVYLIGDAGAPIRVVTGWQPDGADLTLVEVVIASIVWVMIGAAALWLMERRLTHAFRRWIVLAACHDDRFARAAPRTRRRHRLEAGVVRHAHRDRSVGDRRPGVGAARSCQTATVRSAVMPVAGSPETVGI